MNNCIVIKVEYRLPFSEYRNLDIIPNSGSFTEKFSCENAGRLYAFKCQFNIAKICEGNDKILDTLVNSNVQFKITDGNRITHCVGGDIYPTYFLYTREVAAKAGDFNGYRCVITRKASKHTIIVSSL